MMSHAQQPFGTQIQRGRSEQTGSATAPHRGLVLTALTAGQLGLVAGIVLFFVDVTYASGVAVVAAVVAAIGLMLAIILLVRRASVVLSAVAAISALLGIVLCGLSLFGPAPFAAKGEGTVSEGSGPVSFSADGIVVGEQDAPVAIDYYFDFGCPHCRTAYAQSSATFTELIANGKLRVNYHVVSFVNDYSTLAARAAFATAEHQPELFEQVHAVLLDDAIATETWSAATLAAELQRQVPGLSDATLAAAASYEQFVAEQTTAAFEAGLQSVPSVAADGKFLEDFSFTPAQLPEQLGISQN